MNKDRDILFEIAIVLEHPDGMAWDTKKKTGQKLRDIVRILEKNGISAGLDLRSQKEKIISEFQKRYDDLSLLAKFSGHGSLNPAPPLPSLSSPCSFDCHLCQTLNAYDVFLHHLKNLQGKTHAK